jgi:hypothetical protein
MPNSGLLNAEKLSNEGKISSVVAAPRSEQEQMTAERVRADHRLYALGQPIEAAPHVGRFSCQPDPWTRRAIQRLQTR